MPEDLFRKYPFEIASRGYAEWKNSGRMPDPRDVAQRDPEWERVLLLLDAAVNSFKPDEKARLA